MLEKFRIRRKSFIYVRLGATGLRTWCTYSRIRDGTWPTPYISCNYSYRSRTTRIIVELVGIEENYPKSTQVGLLSLYLVRISM
jgi:hypothetical protein